MTLFEIDILSINIEGNERGIFIVLKSMIDNAGGCPHLRGKLSSQREGAKMNDLRTLLFVTD
jgi:hypothetical protein